MVTEPWMPDRDRMVHAFNAGRQAGLDGAADDPPGFDSDPRTNATLAAAWRRGYNGGLQAAMQARYGAPVASRRDGS